MPSVLSYPGVYVEEVSSGVRTVTGVATSVTAFAGAAVRGPINSAVHLFSYSDFERRFGGLGPDMHLGYAVRQFFQNGGADAWVVRIVKSASPAELTLLSQTGANVLKLLALDAGKDGNSIEVRVDYQSGNPASTFNLTLARGSDGLVENYANLSMNKRDPRYVVDALKDSSKLVKVTRLVTQAALDALPAATSVSGALADVKTLINETHSSLQISVNGLAPLPVVISTLDITDGSMGETANDRLDKLCVAIKQQIVNQANGQAPYSGFLAVRENDTIKLTSGAGGEFSSIRILPGASNNASGVLKLGSDSGGIDTDAVASIRPAPVPAPAELTSGAFGATDLDALPDATHVALRISLNGDAPSLVTLTSAGAVGAALAAKLGDVAKRLQAAVRALKPGQPAYRDFTVGLNAAKDRLVLGTGTRGAGSAIAVAAAPANSIAAELHLIAGATVTSPVNVTLASGTEVPYSAADVYPSFIASRADRKGIYALEDVDLFNLLVLPGVGDPGVLSDAAAYCKERRAFFIIDAPEAVKTPADAVKLISGTELPKSDHAAAYYPWVSIPDPLNNGKPLTVPPSGTVAGIFARTDAERGVWKAPAGTEANLIGVQGVEYRLTDGENGSLNPLGLNSLRLFPVYGPVVWGARTLRGADQMTSEYKYIPVRRLALYLEESLFRAIQWVVFEPNDEPLWAQIRLNIGAFMNGLYRQGAFQGKSPREAYLVKCDRETTTQDDINRGVVNILVAFAPLKPAEFVVLRIQQLAGQIQT
ncbi:phage tail sheath subtilisin-like domain-containing protein [Oxalobacteraceae bacterium]|nr:phage tail sheath subtilisin-like domain-containing protein [Oxalobacteraceae bacterium]